MTDKEKLHIIVSGTHWNQAATREHIGMRMLDVYKVPNKRTQLLIDECLEDGTLLPDSRNGFMSTEDPQFDTGEPKTKLSLGKTIALWSGIATIILALFFFYDRFFKH